MTVDLYVEMPPSDVAIIYGREGCEAPFLRIGAEGHGRVLLDRTGVEQVVKTLNSWLACQPGQS